MRLREIARSHAGQTGVLITVSVSAVDARDYPLLERLLTADRVREQLAGLVQKTLVRYAQPHRAALEFVVWPATPAAPQVSRIERALVNMELGANLEFARRAQRRPPSPFALVAP